MVHHGGEHFSGAVSARELLEGSGYRSSARLVEAWIRGQGDAGGAGSGRNPGHRTFIDEIHLNRVAAKTVERGGCDGVLVGGGLSGIERVHQVLNGASRTGAVVLHLNQAQHIGVDSPNSSHRLGFLAVKLSLGICPSRSNRIAATRRGKSRATRIERSEIIQHVEAGDP